MLRRVYVAEGDRFETRRHRKDGEGRLRKEMADRPPPLPGAKKGKHSASNAPKGPLKVVPPPIDQMKPFSEKGMLEKQLMGEGRYSTLFRASSFELFVPKNRVRGRSDFVHVDCVPLERVVVTWFE